MSEGKGERGLSQGGYYYAPKNQISDHTLRLSPDEARHAVRVLRLGIGDEIAVVDGDGGWYRASIDAIDRDGLIASIRERERDVGEPRHKLSIGIGLMKQQGRFETFLEKSVELGVTRIVPMVTERSRSKGLNASRCRRVLLAGLKQSLRSRLPELTPPRRFDQVVRDDAVVRLIAHEGDDVTVNILDKAEAIRKGGACHILIGPEAGFSSAEVERAVSAGWEAVSLGDSRLRSETAAIAVASAVHLIRSQRTVG